MRNIEQLKLRTIDTHSILLGMGEEWSRLNLPWISRDIALLIGQLEDPHQKHDDPLERLSALKICLTQLSLASHNSQATPHQEHKKEPKSFYRESKIISLRELHHHKEEEELIVTTSLSELLNNEEAIQRHAGAISLLVYSDQAVVLGAILKGSNYCPFCYRHLLATPFGLRTPNRQREENQFLEMGVQLGKMVERKPNEMLSFDGASITLQPSLPFIGCPSCFSKESSC